VLSPRQHRQPQAAAWERSKQDQLPPTHSADPPRTARLSGLRRDLGSLSATAELPESHRGDHGTGFNKNWSDGHSQDPAMFCGGTRTAGNLGSGGSGAKPPQCHLASTEQLSDSTGMGKTCLARASDEPTLVIDGSICSIG